MVSLIAIRTAINRRLASMIDYLVADSYAHSIFTVFLGQKNKTEQPFRRLLLLVFFFFLTNP